MTLSQALDVAAEKFRRPPSRHHRLRNILYREIQEWSVGWRPVDRARRAARDHVCGGGSQFPRVLSRLNTQLPVLARSQYPSNFALRQQELSYILEQSDSTVLITMNGCAIGTISRSRYASPGLENRRRRCTLAPPAACVRAFDRHHTTLRCDLSGAAQVPGHAVGPCRTGAARYPRRPEFPLRRHLHLGDHRPCPRV